MSLPRVLHINVVRFAAIPIASTLFAIAAAGQASIPVTVKNTTANPVPTVTTGTTTVTGSVQLTNKFTNAAAVRDVENGSQTAFQASCDLDPNVLNGTACILATAPDGQRLVIESITARAIFDPGQIFTELGFVSTGGGRQLPITFDIEPLIQVSSLGTIIVASKSMRLYADPGTEVECFAAATPVPPRASSFPSFMHCALVGHFSNAVGPF